MPEQDAICTLGSLNLLPSQEEKDQALYYVEALGDESNMGDPEQTITEIESQLIDGSAIGVSAAGNRELTLKVQVVGVNSAALAAGEQALVETCNTDSAGLIPFRFLNPDQAAAVTVFDVIYVHIAYNFADLDDERLAEGKRRRYTLTMTTKPWPRSENETRFTDSAISENETTTVSDGSDAAYWELDTNNLPALIEPGDTAPADSPWRPADGAAIWGGTDGGDVTLRRVKTEDTTGLNMLRVSGYLYYQNDSGAIFPGTQIPHIQVARDSEGGGTTYWGQVVKRRFDGYRFEIVLNNIDLSWHQYEFLHCSAFAQKQVETSLDYLNTYLAIDEVVAMVPNPIQDTDAMRTRVIDIAGTKAAEPTIDIHSFGNELSDGTVPVMIYTSRIDTGIAGSILNYRDSGPERTDLAAATDLATLTHGYSYLAATKADGDVFKIPVHDLAPGTYQLAATLAPDSDVGLKSTILWSVSNWNETATGEASPTLGELSTYQYCPLGDVTLPLVEYEDASQVTNPVTITVWSPTAADTTKQVKLDTVLLFNMTNGDLTVLGPLSGNLVTRVGIQAPTNQDPRPKVWEQGNNFTSEAGADVLIRGVHRLEPPAARIWTSAIGVADHYITASYYPRWHSYAAYLTNLLPPTIASPADGATVSAAPTTISGAGEPGTTLVVLIDGSVLAQTTVEDSGAWSVPIEKNLSEGEHTVSAYQVNSQGEASPPATVTFTLDTVAPTAPVITNPGDGDNLNAPTVTITGTAARGSNVDLTITPTATSTVSGGDPVTAPIPPSGIPVGSSGTWSVIVEGFTDGGYTIVAAANDAAGNTSPDSTPVTFTVDLGVPDPPAVTYPTDGGVFNGTDLVITGTGEPGADITVDLVRAGSSGFIRHATVTSEGTWSLEVEVEAGSWTITATQVDAAGNRSDAVVVTFAVDTHDYTPPDPPVITSIDGQTIPADDGDGSAAPVVVDSYTPTVAGTGEPGARITVTAQSGASVKTTTTVGEDSTWSMMLDEVPGDSVTVTAVQEDEAGNVSDPSTAIQLVVVTDTVVATWDFEDSDLGGWVPYGDGDVGVSPPGHDSAQSMGVTTINASEAYSADCDITQELRPGLTYRGTFFAYRPDAVAKNTKLSVLGNGIGAGSSTSGTTTDEWEPLTLEFTTNPDYDPGTNSVHLRVTGNTVDSSGQRLRYDDGLLEIVLPGANR